MMKVNDVGWLDIRYFIIFFCKILLTLLVFSTILMLVGPAIAGKKKPEKPILKEEKKVNINRILKSISNKIITDGINTNY